MKLFTKQEIEKCKTLTVENENGKIKNYNFDNCSNSEKEHFFYFNGKPFAWSVLKPLSEKSQVSRKPLPPGDLVGACHDNIHRETGRVRGANAIKIRKKMNKFKETNSKIKNDIEKLAEYAHDSWSGWMKYLFSKCKPGDNNVLIIPEKSVKRWVRQMTTPYKDLSEEEKESDRIEAVKILATFYKEDS